MFPRLVLITILLAIATPALAIGPLGKTRLKVRGNITHTEIPVHVRVGRFANVSGDLVVYQHLTVDKRRYQYRRAFNTRRRRLVLR